MDDGDVRVSDLERQRVVDSLSAAVGEGLLSLDEFAEHAGAAYAAITRDQLDAVTRELRLPVVAPPSPPPAPFPTAAPGPTPAMPKRKWIVAVMSGEKRNGKWRASRRTGAFAFWGNVTLDLRDAVLDGEAIEISAWAVMGSVDVVVPEGIPVESGGFMLMGGRTNRIKNVPPLPGAPEIVVKGYGLWGGITVRSKPPRREGEPEHDVVRDALGLAHDVAHQAMAMAPRAATRPPAPPTTAEVAPRAGFVTIVCTDIVGSTRYADTLGDQRWRALLGAHNTLVRDQLARHGGDEVKTSGDGFLLTFASPRSAVHFAVDVQAALGDFRNAHPDTPIEVRVGVHAGEVERDGNDLVGRNVSLACRLCDVASPGEVLVSGVVADLTDSASDLAFGAGRPHHLAGIERPVTARPATRR